MDGNKRALIDARVELAKVLRDLRNMQRIADNSRIRYMIALDLFEYTYARDLSKMQIRDYEKLRLCSILRLSQNVPDGDKLLGEHLVEAWILAIEIWRKSNTGVRFEMNKMRYQECASIMIAMDKVCQCDEQILDYMYKLTLGLGYSIADIFEKFECVRRRCARYDQ